MSEFRDVSCNESTEANTATMVANGVAFLDKEYPGWEHEIDIDDLDIASSTRCILGQLYRGNAEPYESGFDWAMDNLDFEGNHYVHGFAGHPFTTFEQLNHEWVRIITERV
jgi:hypothetical protein